MPDISPGIEYPKEKPWLTSRNNNEKGSRPKSNFEAGFFIPHKKTPPNYHWPNSSDSVAARGLVNGRRAPGAYYSSIQRISLSLPHHVIWRLA